MSTQPIFPLLASGLHPKPLDDRGMVLLKGSCLPRDRSVWLSLGHCLKAQYDALAPPIPQRIAALVEQLERQNLGLPRRHWLDYDPVALAVLVIGIATIELLALMI